VTSFFLLTYEPSWTSPVTGWDAARSAAEYAVRLVTLEYPDEWLCNLHALVLTLGNIALPLGLAAAAMGKLPDGCGPCSC
jgi:hypothetical protein